MREAHAIVREAHAKTGPLSVRFFGFIRESVGGIGNAKPSWKDNSMQIFHRAPLALIVVMAAALISLSSPVLHAQSAALESVESEAIPEFGTFWSLQLGDDSPPMPFLPSYLGDVKVYYLGDGNSYFYDDLDFSYENYLAKQAEIMAEADGLMSLDGAGENSAMAMSFSTNDLWLEIVQMTNTTADLVIHPPWDVTNGVYDLYFRTNLNHNPTSTFSLQWSRIERTTPGQTNLVVTNLLSDQGFFRIGPLTNAIRSGFDQQYLDRNDDNEDVTNLLAAIGFSINFFGTSYTNLYLNNNGNVTFDDQLPSYTPDMLLVDLAIKIIAPFWADVDTRNTNSDVVRYGTNVVDGHNAFGVEWVNVGYYAQNADKLLSCQLVIIQRSDLGTNAFDTEFNYDKVEWQWGAVSPGWPARAGYSDGTTNHTYELPGSGVEDAFLDSNFDTGLIYHSLDGPRTNLLSSPVSGRYRFFFRNGEPLP